MMDRTVFFFCTEPVLGLLLIEIQRSAKTKPHRSSSGAGFVTKKKDRYSSDGKPEFHLCGLVVRHSEKLIRHRRTNWQINAGLVLLVVPDVICSSFLVRAILNDIEDF